MSNLSENLFNLRQDTKYCAHTLHTYIYIYEYKYVCAQDDSCGVYSVYNTLY